MDEGGADMDIDQCLVGKFSSLGTTDKDVLIGEFRKLLGFQLNVSGCEFFLDMTNWNLHAAIGAYYDFEMPSVKTPSMSFVRDITIGEGEAIPPNTEFLKTWRIQNSGNEQWPFGCSLRFVNGDKMGAADWVAVDSLTPGHSLDICVKMRSPNNTGIYQGQWKIYTRNMVPFGDTIWVIISVEVGGLLGVTQQMSQFACTLGSPTKVAIDSQMEVNPFTNGMNHNTSKIVFGNTQGSFKTIDSGNSQAPHHNHMDAEMIDKEELTLRGLTNTPELELQPSAGTLSDSNLTCWNTKSPTHGSIDRLSGTSHSLHSITEENVTSPSDKVDTNFLTSSSSYDLSARQITPCNSPTHLLHLEQSFNSPDAPSPIRPTSQNLVYKNSPSAAQKLDF